MAWLKTSILLAATVGILAAGTASAQTTTSPEIKATLEGNSISNEDEIQYFNPDGTTIYQKGSKSVSGRWRIDGDKLCSDVSTDVRLLDSGGKGKVWQCHAVMGDRKRIAFLIEGHAYSWTVSEGKKVR
jgi:hypothetical protein